MAFEESHMLSPCGSIRGSAQRGTTVSLLRLGMASAGSSHQHRQRGEWKAEGSSKHPSVPNPVPHTGSILQDYLLPLGLEDGIEAAMLNSISDCVEPPAWLWMLRNPVVNCAEESGASLKQ